MDQALKDYRVQEKSFQNILVAIDIDDFTSSDHAFNCACTMALNTNAQLGVVTVLETKDVNVFDSMSPDKMNDKRLEVSHDLLTYVQKAKDFGVENVHPILAEGNPDKVILDDVVRDFQPDLIIVGSEAKKLLGKTVGREAEEIVEHSAVSVLVVRD
ncbi:universal stress protein [Bombilactobacillus folatiphilus]|uniref:Universal stress protein n=1 Tax=Bombilactobacillus folatiphilus TaxID=2923362 RepID=A0ABY4P8N2_9LACO|nr:universal stress protein [Bombilactobacillus folatiphilus]UQS82007.1 universal stress protein [Bombilactobacillus folatiphilus]